jgi:RHS repeat-associated protein
VSKNGVTVQNNTYSGDGSRVEQTLGSSSSIVYTYEGRANNILFEKNLTSSIVTKNYYANGLLLGEIVGSSAYYLLDDALGSIRDVTTATPVSTVFSTDYQPYGQTYGLSESLSIFNFEYTHKPYDTSTGFYYYGARYYNPSISRFITEDSIQYSNILDPLSLNRYSYVENNPESRIDPSGNVYVTGGYHWYDPSTSQATTPPPPAPPPPVTTSPPQTPSPPPAPPNHYYYNYRTMHMMQSQSNFQSKASTGSTSTESSGPGFWNWFERHPLIYDPLLATVAGDVASIFDPFARGIFKQVVLVVIQDAGAILGDFQDIVQLFVNHDLGAIASYALDFSWNLIQAVIAKASLWQKIVLLSTGAVTELADAATAETLQAALATIGIFQLVTDITLGLGMDYHTYNTIYPNG